MIANIRSFTLNIIMVFKIFMRSLLSRIISNDIIIYLIAEVYIALNLNYFKGNWSIFYFYCDAALN